MDLKDIVALNRGGALRALPSFCTANTWVLHEIVSFAAQHDIPALIEATCNQVNQFGGYTGTRPSEFASMVRKLAARVGLPDDNLILGGDHLGPNPWKHLPAPAAMDHAKVLVKDYVEAGFAKIHLDASMACADEDMLSFDQVAERSAELCVVAEAHAPEPDRLSYVIGTEVPVPGGESDGLSGIVITSPERLRETIETHESSFARLGVSQGMERAVAVVVQPGVDFSQDAVFSYVKDEAVGLTKAIKEFEGLAFEAHSTDFQQTAHLRQLVEDRSAFLKVGPEITFRFREAIMALDQIESLVGVDETASVMTVVIRAMEDDPSDWKDYYRGATEDVEVLRLYSFSDRIRYYWDRPPVKVALDRLIANLRSAGIPSAIASQFGMRDAERKARFFPEEMIADRVRQTVERYYRATGWL